MRGGFAARQEPGFRHSASAARVNALKAPSGLQADTKDFSLESKFTEIEGIRVHYWEGGKGFRS